jgi:hypothetical protein
LTKTLLSQTDLTQSMPKKIELVLIILLLVPVFSLIRPAKADNLIQDSWEELAPMHQARLGLGVIAVDGKIYAIGGTTSGGFICSVLSTNEQYDPVTNSWVYKASMPTARVYFCNCCL